MTLKYEVISCVVCLGIGAGVSQIYFPRTQTTTLTKDVVHTQVQTVTKTVKLPSGEVDTTTTSNQDTNQIVTQHDTTPVLNPQKDWLAGLSYGINIHDLQPIYGAAIKHRVFNTPFFGGLDFNTTGYAGVTLSAEF